ncbi:A/G-specific adenine glycosylase [Tabrizicola sp.]|uniref:A/G-specific adenine glycosylase n=1 Tax=Tabrizicola sp. TaxID=2005166 RepID=UPI00286BF7F7|nr:A/G-specific adenine glycosylase [Tabrizicola sp.]
MRDTVDPDGLSDQLLRWYDAHARVMPWRTLPQDRAAGVRPDPYRVWLSEVMLQQTTVAAVKDYFHRFTARWPDVAALAAARDADVMGEWAGLGYYARARNLLKCARAVVAEHGGRFPGTVAGLRTLPGIGPYTAAAIAAIAFDEAATVVDGNVERVMARLHLVQTPLPDAKAELTRLAAILTPALRPGDYAQAVMDLGATICTPRNPACGLCPWMQSCLARREGVQADLPRKRAKPEKPTRHGVLWLARRGDAWLLERRPDKGLLGGMLGFPGDAWDGAGGPAPAEAEWTEIGEVRHTFTHFHLILRLHIATLGREAVLRGTLVPKADFRPADLPTVMRKAFDLASSALALS